jgi:hypothetical protein
LQYNFPWKEANEARLAYKAALIALDLIVLERSKNKIPPKTACSGDIAAPSGREFPRQVDARAARMRIEHTTQHISGELPKEKNDYARRAHT